ncbi:MAG: hypothetical protein JO222_06390, partial [Frankiales bacterium]|nr:hypothetical protein [Frankiales bacterium]
MGLLVASAATLVAGVTQASAASTNGDKVTICHRTNSNKNPYVQITVSVNAVDGKKKNDHSHHTGPVWDPTLKAQHIKWGDIIP